MKVKYSIVGGNTSFNKSYDFHWNMNNSNFRDVSDAIFSYINNFGKDWKIMEDVKKDFQIRIYDMRGRSYGIFSNNE